MRSEREATGSGDGLPRREDRRLLTGRGRFVGDLEVPGTLALAVLRSPYAHARVRRVDLGRAEAVAGVALALDGRRLARRAPALQRATVQPALAVEEVAYAGQPLAAVLARDRYVAEDALEEAEVEYEPLPVVGDARRALEEGAPPALLSRPSNLCSERTVGYGEVEAALAEAEVVVEEELAIGRATAQPLEGRAILAVPEAGGGLTVWAAHQAPHQLRAALAAALGLEERQVRVVTPDVGGGFGVKNGVYPEDLLAAWLALETGRPVRFLEDRREHFLSTNHEREQIHRVRLAARRDGRLLALDDVLLSDVGAFPPRVPIGLVTATTMPGPYHLPAYRCRVLEVFTNKVPIGPYRGAGRPQGNFVMERMMDRLARRLGMDPVELRQRNLIRPEEMPYATGLPYRGGPGRVVYDSGDYPAALRQAVERADVAGWRAEQARARQEGRWLGVGVAVYVEDTGGGPFEAATARLDPSGRVVVASGSPAQGQGHETTFARVAADALGVDAERVTVVASDTAQVPAGIGTFGSRGVAMGGSAVHEAAVELRRRILAAASRLLEVAEEDLLLEGGDVRVRGVPGLRLSLAELARRLRSGEAQEGGRALVDLASTVAFAPGAPTFADGAHVAVVEVDPETGGVRVLRYVVAHDCGRMIHPPLVEGQVRGGVMYGLSGALLEELVYDEQGQLLTSTLAEYALPSTEEMPPVEISHLESPTPLNPLGAKGAGEGGTIPALAALANAVEDALAPLGVVVRRLPMTPARVRAWVEEAGRAPGEGAGTGPHEAEAARRG
ncbi:MAG: xanthine dehydrogenase family protein molybdopterin-binding subunit [Bacillota bacterium]|nr:xanthine dehydrogenase family protein molybdopterin-binding subunit [Bacillota bacterium]